MLIFWRQITFKSAHVMSLAVQRCLLVWLARRKRLTTSTSPHTPQTAARTHPRAPTLRSQAHNEPKTPPPRRHQCLFLLDCAQRIVCQRSLRPAHAANLEESCCCEHLLAFLMHSRPRWRPLAAVNRRHDAGSSSPAGVKRLQQLAEGHGQWSTETLQSFWNPTRKARWVGTSGNGVA